MFWKGFGTVYCNIICSTSAYYLVKLHMEKGVFVELSKVIWPLQILTLYRAMFWVSLNKIFFSPHAIVPIFSSNRLPCCHLKWYPLKTKAICCHATKAWTLLLYYLVWEHFLFLVLLFGAYGLMLSQYWKEHLMKHRMWENSWWKVKPLCEVLDPNLKRRPKIRARKHGNVVTWHIVPSDCIWT